jgi:DNA-binding transcriptional LysR family regulator
MAHGHAEHVSFRADLPVAWIARRGMAVDREATLPLALLDPPCMFRQMAVEALEGQKRNWRLALTSPSLAGLWAAVQAGLGVTVRTSFGLPDELAVMDAADLPGLPSISLVIASRSRRLSPAGERLRSILTEQLDKALAEKIPESIAARPPRHALHTDEFPQPIA